MRTKLPGLTNAQKPACQTGVVEEQFGHLHQPFAQVGFERGKVEGGEARFQDAEPSLGGWLGNPAVASQRGVVEQLRGATRTEFHEAPKPVEISDTDVRAHVALDMSGKKRTQPVGGIKASIEYEGIAAKKEGLLESGGVLGEASRLVLGRRQAMMHCSSSG